MQPLRSEQAALRGWPATGHLLLPGLQALPPGSRWGLDEGLG